MAASRQIGQTREGTASGVPTPRRPPINADPDLCPVQSAIRVIAGRWKPLIMFHLMDGPRRFGELRQQIPEISQRILTKQLRELESQSLVSRKVYAEVPPHTEYALTELGRDLDDVFAAIARWGVRFLQEQRSADSSAPAERSVTPGR